VWRLLVGTVQLFISTSLILGGGGRNERTIFGRALTETSKSANSASNKVEGVLVYIANGYGAMVA
jgi:hypothetical protein